MAGKIIADTLETGAGADISTSYVVNGSAKAWADIIGAGTPSVANSNNVSSLTDNGTGDTTISFTGSMDSGNYSIAGIAGGQSGVYWATAGINKYTGAASSCRVLRGFTISFGGGATNFDYTELDFMLQGDLA